jgi:hypothetical protein
MLVNKWVIVCCNYGRLGNRLHTHANILAWCIRNNYNLLNLSFRQYSCLFEPQKLHNVDMSLRKRSLTTILLRIKILRDLITKLVCSQKWIKRFRFLIYCIDKNDSEILDEKELENLKTRKIILIKAWDIRCKASINLVGDQIRKILYPAFKYEVSANCFINQLKTRHDCLVGIHARRGDYKHYLNGIHYHGWAEYLNWVSQLQSILTKKGYINICFIIGSDDKVPCDIANNQNIYSHKSRDMMTDLRILTLCDWNIGPPSSFGTWVSWFGQVPRLEIYKQNRILSLDQFKICSSC